MSRWSIRNYNAFLREARKKADLTQGQARNAYKAMSTRLGRSLFSTDIKKHPRMFGDARRISTKVKAPPRRVGGEGVPTGSGGGAGGGTAVNSMRDWSGSLSGFDMDIDYGWDEFESSANYAGEYD